MTDQTTAPAKSPKPRSDAFDGARKRVFLEALGKCGCLRDAARKAGVSHQTVYNHQASDKAFARQCALALEMASTDVELHAWERGVVGIEEPIVYRGEIIGTRLKRSDAILRLLLQGAKRRKYGPNPGFGRRQLHKLERERIGREVRAEFREKKKHLDATREETDQAILKKLDALSRRRNAERTAAGWVQVGNDWIPPGWVRAEDTASDPAEIAAGLPSGTDEGLEQKPDSV